MFVDIIYICFILLALNYYFIILDLLYNTMSSLGSCLLNYPNGITDITSMPLDTEETQKTYATAVLKIMRVINACNIKNASEEDKIQANTYMIDLYNDYKDKRENQGVIPEFDTAIFQAIKGFEDKNPGLKVLGNYEEYELFYGSRTSPASEGTLNAVLGNGLYKRWGGKRKTRKYKHGLRLSKRISKKHKTKKHNRKTRR
jgi:hypothetical protein